MQGEIRPKPEKYRKKPPAMGIFAGVFRI